MATTRQRRPSPRRRPRQRRTDSARYSPLDRKLLWIRNGGPAKYANAMAIVSVFENRSGDPTVVNSIGATGLWQIYNGPNTDTERLKNPDANARAAVKKFRDAKRAGGTGFEPWVSSKGGWGPLVDEKTGKVNEDAARSAGIEFGKSFLEGIASGPLGDAINTAIKPLEPLAAVGELALGLTELLLTPEGWRRLLKVIIGGVVLLWALNQLSKSMFDVNPARGARRAATAVAVKKAV